MIIKYETLTILELNEIEVKELKYFLNLVLTHDADNSFMRYEDAEIARTLYDDL